MHMTELTTPYEKRKVIECGSGRNFNTPVRHWHEVQQVAGPLYKSREVENRYGEQECDLYLFYDGIPAGLRFMRQKRIEDRDTPEYLLGLVQNGGLGSLSGYMDNLKQDMDNSRWIGLADIEFVRQFDEAQAQRLAAYRQGRLVQREQAWQAEENKRLEAEAAAAEKLRQEKQSQRDAFLGWADDMSELRFGQVKKVMERKGRFNGTVITRRDFVIKQLLEGLVPICVNRSRSNEYRLYDSVKRDWYIVTKTEHDFAKYLTDSGKIESLK